MRHRWVTREAANWSKHKEQAQQYTFPKGWTQDILKQNRHKLGRRKGTRRKERGQRGATEQVKRGGIRDPKHRVTEQDDWAGVRSAKCGVTKRVYRAGVRNTRRELTEQADWDCLFLLMPVLMAPTPPSMCTPLRTLNESLSHRRRYMKHYFPVNYTIRVHHEEVFKISNISKMKLQVDDLEELHLQRMWFLVNHSVLKRIIRVLPERHPSRPYTTKLERRLQDAEGVFVESHPPEAFQQELPGAIQDIWDCLTEESGRVPESSWRSASPKSLLDNFCHTMHCLYSECFASAETQDRFNSADKCVPG
nr:interleukin-34-like [Nerophis lumbriciformis]